MIAQTRKPGVLNLRGGGSDGEEEPALRRRRERSDMSTRTRGRPRQLMPEAGKRLVHPSHPEGAAADLEQIPQPSQCTQCRSLCSQFDDEGWPCQSQCVIKKITPLIIIARNICLLQ